MSKLRTRWEWKDVEDLRRRKFKGSDESVLEWKGPPEQGVQKTSPKVRQGETRGKEMRWVEVNRGQRRWGQRDI